MNIKINQVISNLESIKHRTKNGGEYWMARELMGILGYTKWKNFETVIEKAKDACAGVGEEINNHFLDTGKMVTIGSGANVNISDYYLDRYACYLIAQNGESSKEEVAAAQTYFAI